MGIFCSKIMRYLVILLMVTIFIHGSSQLPNDQVLNIVGKLLDRDHGTDLNEHLARHLTKDHKMSLKEGLSTLLEIVKDGDNDSLALKNEPNVDEIDGSMEADGSSMEAKESLGEKFQSRALSNHTESNGKTEDEESDMKVVAMHPVFEEDQKQKSSSAFRLWKEQKEDRKRASSRSLSGDSNKCPDGYVYGLQGDVPQAGLISLSTGRNIPANRERCAEICNHNSRCKSFFFSPTVGQCKISSELIPTDRPYRDWIMCTKSDATCSQGYTYKTGSVDGDTKTLVEAPLMIDRTGMTDGSTDEECKIACDLDQTCKSFEYSSKKQKCVKRNIGKPKSNSSAFEDFHWCSKNECKTTSGPVVNKKCVFPFIWRGKKYETCTNVGRKNKGKFWCPTSTGDINVTKSSKTWGFCSDDCPRHQDHCYAISGPGVGKDCIFPFSDRGITYTRCAKSHPLGSPQWCKTDKKEALTERFDSFGICHSGCDKVKDCSWERLDGNGKVAKNEGNTVASHSSKTLDECKDLCDLNIQCKSFSFTQKGGMCKLKDRILSRGSGTKHVPGTCTYYQPAACHDDNGNTALAGRRSVAAERVVSQGMKRPIPDSRSYFFEVGDTHGSGSKDAANEIQGSYRTGEGNDAHRIGGGYRLGSEDAYKGSAGSDVFDAGNIVREVGENYGPSLEGIAHGNEGGNGSRVADDGRSIRDGSVSRTGNKGGSEAKEGMWKKQAKNRDDVLKHQNFLKKLDGFHNENV